MGAFSRPRSTGSRGQRPHTRATSRSVQLLPPPPLSAAAAAEAEDDGAALPPRLRSRRGEADDEDGSLALEEGAEAEADADMPRPLARLDQKRRTHSASGMTVFLSIEIGWMRKACFLGIHQPATLCTSSSDSLPGTPGHLQGVCKRRGKYLLQERVQMRRGETHDVGGLHEVRVLEQGGHLGEELLALQHCGVSE